MPLPRLLSLPDEAAYRAYFEAQYCNTTVVTFDGITVQFFTEIFNEAFYRDSSRTARDKANFDLKRAQRMDWIRAVLEDSSLEVYRRAMPSSKIRRIALEPTTPYAVIIQIDSRNARRARFITAYIVDSPSALTKMRSNPRW
jgi:hypothetical protein